MRSLQLSWPALHAGCPITKFQVQFNSTIKRILSGAIQLALVSLLVALVVYTAVYHKFLLELYRSLTGEADVGGISLLGALKKFSQFYIANPLDREVHEELWEKDRWLCHRETVYNFQNPELTCFYKNDNHFLKIAPVKVEVLHRRPLILLYKQIISDSLARGLILLTRGHLQNVTAYNPLTGQQQVSAYRQSQYAFIWPSQSDLSAETIRSVAMATGLSTETADALQIARYETGGHYSPHYDFYDDPLMFIFKNEWVEKRGNNLATILIYLTDAPHHGGTIFPRLNLTVTPMQGEAIFWFNIKPDGNVNRLMWHAGCELNGPKSEKWIANVWLGERGQEFIRSCHRDKEYFE